MMQEFRFNIFTKVGLIILLLLIPIVFLYTYSNRVAVGVLQDKIEASQYNQFEFFLNQMTAQIDATANNAVVLSKDRSVIELQYVHLYDDSESIRAKEMITSKLFLQLTTTDWINKLAVYAPSSHTAVSVDSSGSSYIYNLEDLSEGIESGWKYSEGEEGIKEFTWFTVDPFYAYEDLSKAKIIVEASFTADTLISFLDSYQQTGKGNPFLYHSEHGIIANQNIDMDKAQAIATRIDQSYQDSSEVRSIIYYEDYLVMTMKSEWMGWTVVDYVALKEILKPIRDTNKWFYASIALLLFLSMAAAFLLYRHVRLPLKELVRSLQSLKRGDFSTRILMRPKNEFNFVMIRFNEMVIQIEQLIDKVYLEQLRTREAELKQLQSQINPHFLYNCLHFIKNMTILGDDKAVIAMSVNLGSYFRYVTRLENHMAPLRSEVELIHNYLTIQKLRMKRIDFSIQIPEIMLDMEVPRLILQPIVENAVIYGLEPRENDGQIRITGEEKDGMFYLSVEDNGHGMSAKQMADLQSSLNQPMNKEMGYGMWNVHQRLIYQFGEGSGVRFSGSQWGGLKVILEWKRGDSPPSP